MTLLDIPEVAKVLGVSIERAYELARTDVLPVVRVGRQVRIDATKLAEWIDEGGAPLPGGWRRDATC